MRDIPLSKYLEWPDANYVDPETRGSALLAINIVFIILVTLSIIIRLYSRIYIKHQSGIDDVMIVIAYICTVGITADVILANRKYGWDRHVWDVPVSMIQSANIVAFVAKLLFTFASTFTRLSLIFLFYRLIKDTNLRWYAWALHFNLALNVGILITFIFLTTFNCVPVQAYWQFPDVLDGKCLDEGVITLAAGVVTCIADLLCTVTPIPAVWRLRMPMRQRLGVCVLLSAGIVVTVAGVVRTYFIYKSLIGTYDETWFTYPLWICAAIEVDLAVICACVPSMKSVLWMPFRHWASTLSSQYTSRYRRDTKGYKSQRDSQDPIVDTVERIKLTNMDFEKGRFENRGDMQTLEQAIAQIPSSTNHHPHAVQRTKSHGSSSNGSEQLAPIAYDPSGQSSKLEINKQTTFQVSSSDERREADDQFLMAPPPAGRAGTRPRHRPLFSRESIGNVTPRSPRELFSSRRNQTAALSPISPEPVTVAQNPTSPLPEPSPLSPTSADSFDPNPSRERRKGGTFFFG